MDDLTGRKLGKYTLESRLGAGGMASVYRSTHPQLNRPVAIKVLPEKQHTDESLRLRFEREAQAMAALNHPTLIRIYDIDREDALIYMVMDLVQGGSIDDRLRSGTPMGLYWACDVVARVAEALDIAHRKGIVHRDIKPSNILLTTEDDPVIADFGIAKMVQGEESDLTSAGTIMGTPLYMAPEQIKGNDLDGRADIYALGIVLYQLLTGHTPFRGDAITVITKQLTEPPPSPRLEIPDLPQPLEEVVLRALSKEPAQRFASGTEFARAIRSAMLNVGTENMVRAAPTAQPIAYQATRPAQVPLAPTEAITAPDHSRSFWIKLAGGGFLALIGLIVIYQVIKALFVPLLIIALGAAGFYWYRRQQQTNAQPAGSQPGAAQPPALDLTQPLPRPRLAPLQQGLALYRGGQFPQALAAFNQALEDNASSVDALISRGLLYYTLGDLPKAQADFEAALQLNPRHSRARYQRALALLALGQNDAAREDLTALSKSLPEQADLRREVLARLSSLNNADNETALFESPFRTGQIDRAEIEAAEQPHQQPPSADSIDRAEIEAAEQPPSADSIDRAEIEAAEQPHQQPPSAGSAAAVQPPDQPRTPITGPLSDEAPDEDQPAAEPAPADSPEPTLVANVPPLVDPGATMVYGGQPPADEAPAS